MGWFVNTVESSAEVSKKSRNPRQVDSLESMVSSLFFVISDSGFRFSKGTEMFSCLNSLYQGPLEHKASRWRIGEPLGFC
jgi:hypothetical protein